MIVACLFAIIQSECHFFEPVIRLVVYSYGLVSMLEIQPFLACFSHSLLAALLAVRDYKCASTGSEFVPSSFVGNGT